MRSDDGRRVPRDRGCGLGETIAPLARGYADCSPSRPDLINTPSLKTWRGVRITTVGGISADGRTIVGFGINPDGFTEGWIGHMQLIPAPGAALPAMLGMPMIGWVKRRFA